MKNDDVISGVIGASFFAVPYALLNMPVVPALLIGASAFAAGKLVFKNNKKEFSIKNMSMKQILDNARKENKHILAMSNVIDDADLKKDIKEINASVNRIINAISKEPKKEKKIKNFFDYYLPVTVKLLDRFDEVENQNLSSKEYKEFMESTKKTISTINDVFKDFINKLYSSEMDDENVEIKVLNNMLKADGLDKSDILVKDDKNE